MHRQARVDIVILGGFEILLDGECRTSIFLRKQKLVELLQMVVAYGGHDVPSKVICGALWPNANSNRALQNLEISIHRLRALLGHRSINVSSRFVGISSRHCHLDLWDLEDSMEALEQILLYGAPTLERLKLATDDCIEAYTGPMLPDVDTPWVHAPRSDIRSRLIRQVQAAASVIRERDAADQAASLLERVVAAEHSERGPVLAESGIIASEALTAASPQRKSVSKSNYVSKVENRAGPLT